MSETPLGSNRLTDSNPSRPNNQSPSFPKPLDLSRDNSQPEYLPTTSQLLLVPTKSNPDAARFSPHNNSIVHSSFSQEATRDLIRPRPLDRRTSGYSSRRSEGPGEGDFGHVSGISMRHERKRREKRNSIKSSISPANRSYLGTNHSRSIGIHDDTSQELNSYSYSGLHQIQQYYHDHENRSMISNVDSTAKRKKQQWKSKVKDTYYRLLRKRLGRRHSYIRKDPSEFDEQIAVINDNVRIPNEERIQDLKLVEKTRYETLQRYTDKYPLLNLRKKVMILASQISSLCHTIVTSPIFDFFILLIIISNTILLALDDPTNDNDLLSSADNYFLGVYTAEMALKIFGLGFVWNHGSYLRDPWNILDFVIVVTGYLPLIMTSNALNLRALRSLRVFRPLKTISTIHALRVIVVTLMAAMKPLLETIFILLFLFLIFAIAGLQLFSGSMKKRCFSLESGIPLADQNNDSDFDEKLCISDGDCGMVDGNLYICGKMLQNPNYGVTNFDNIFSALLMAFQTVTTEGWSQTMEILQETFSPVAAIYFIVLIFLGSFFLLNLTLAIIKAEYTGNSRMNISVKRAQKTTYDDRFMQKISDHKLDILKLIHKNKTGETLYDKYHFKNDQLIAVETSKHANHHSSPKKKKESVKKKKSIAPSGLMFLNSFWRLRGGINYGAFRRVTANSTVLPESKTDIPTMLDLGSENNLDMKKIKPGSFKIFPDKGSMTDLVHKDTSDQAALALAVTAPSEKPSPMQAPMGLRLGQKFGSKQSSDSPADSPFAGNVQQHSPPNKFEDAVDLQENNNQPHADQSNVQVYKQARGFGDLKIRITEAAQENNMVYNEDSEQVQSSVFPRMYPPQGLPSSVPSIIEEEEASELSPSRISEYTNGSRVAKKQLWSRGARPSHKEPVRPVMTEKVRMSSEEKVMKSGGIEMINIAGIRNKKQSRSQQPKKEQRIESDPMLATSQELPDDEDMMDDDEWFLEFLKKQEEEKRTNSRETRTRAALIQKINQIKRLSDSQRRFFSGQGRSALESDGHSQKGSRRLSSWLASEDFDVNYTRNSGSQFKSSMQKTGGILEDSDFMNRSKKSKNSPKRRNRLYPMKKKQAIGRKPGLLRGLTLKNNPNFNIEEEKEQEDEGEVQVEKKEPEEEMEALMTEEDIIEIKEQEKHMIVNLKKLKAQPLRERNYASYSLDDVIPSKKIQEKLRQQEEEKRRIKENRLAQVYRITTAERKAAKERELQIQKAKQDKGWNLAIKTGALGKILRKQKEEEKVFDDDINAALEKGRGSQGEKTGSLKQGKIFSKGIMNNTGGRLVNSISKVSNGTGKGQVKKKVEEMKVEEEEEFTEEQRKDIFAVLRKMQTPFANEKENEESDEYKKKMTGFAFEEEHRKIRVKDLEMDNVSTLNWSGHAVLSLTYNDVPADRIKEGLNNRDWDIWRPGVMGVIHELRRITRKIIALQAFNAIIILSVFMNTIILACDGLVEDEGTLNAFSSLNDAFTIIFAVEMGLKVFGLGVMTYAMDTINLFDAIVVILSIVEQVAVDGKNSAAGAFRVIRLFRTLRVLRVTKLLRALSYMQVIIGVIIRSAKKFIYVLLLLMLMIIIYALLGMQLYGGKLYVDANNVENLHTRTNFDQFGTALLTVFQVMTQEDWNTVLFLMMRSSVNGIITCAYLISWMFIGNYIFLNLFLALLLDEFTGDEVKEDLEEIEAGEEEVVRETKGTTRISSLTKKSSHLSQRTQSISSLPSLSGMTDFDDEEGVVAEEMVMFKGVSCSKSFYLFSKFNIFRRFCYRVIKHRYFERVILAIIALSSLKLVLDTYISSDNTRLTKVSQIFDCIFVGCFAIEGILKMVSYGFVIDKNSYLRDPWNVLDFIIIIASLLDVSITNIHLSFVKVLRLLRTLRPLRFISHNQNMRIVVSALLESVGAIFNVLIVMLIVWMMFAILGVNLLGDQSGSCNLPTNDISYYGISQTQCISMGYQWQVNNVNFNNIFNGMLTLFIFSTQEGWPQLMYQFADSNTADVGPTLNNNGTIAYIFVPVFLFVGSYFLLNLFVGVIFMNFIRAQNKENSKLYFLTEQQKKWVAVQRLVLLTKPDLTVVRPQTKWRKPYFNLITHDYFEYFIMVSIVLNIIVMAMNYDDASTTYTNVLSYINYFFSFVFVVELVLKHLGLGIKRYWSSGWNRFDGVVVVASIIDITFDVMNMEAVPFLRAGPQLARVFRILRISRLFKLIRRFRGLRKLINTLIFSLPSLLNIGALLFLVYFIYAVLGTFLFGDIASGNNDIDGHFNFNNFLNAFIILFRASTGEDWFGIMFDTQNPLTCVDGASSCGSGAAIVYWLSFIIICQFIFLNLFILAVLQQFEEYHLNPNNPVNKFREKLKGEFDPLWQSVAAKYGGTKIPEKQIIPFFMALTPPLGFKGTDLTRKEMAIEITQMQLTADSAGMVFYNDVLYASMKRVYGHEELIGAPKCLVKEEVKVKRKLEKIKKKFNFKRSDSLVSSTSTNKASAINPIFRMLFLGMTMKTWINYSKRVSEKMKAAKENGFEYVASDSDENDYEYLESEDENMSSPSIERDLSQRSQESRSDVEDVEELQDEGDEHISEENSEEAKSEGEVYSSFQKKPQRQRQQGEIASESEENDKDEFGSHKEIIEDKQQLHMYNSDAYKWIVHKAGSHSKGTPKGAYGDYMPSSERGLVYERGATGQPIVTFPVTPRKMQSAQSVRLDSDWGSPERLSPNHFLKLGNANLAESSKTLFELLEADKSMSPNSQRHDMSHNKEEFQPTMFELNNSPTFPGAEQKVKIPLFERLDSNSLAPPLNREMSGPLSAKLNASRENAAEFYETAKKDFLNIPISMSRIQSKNDGKATPRDNTPKSSLDFYKNFHL